MGRPATVSDAQILEAARELFLKQGTAATVEGVAQRVGVSQAAIFKRFKTKQGLFLAAMVIERERRDWPGQIRRRTQEVGLREALTEAGVEIIGFAKKAFPLVLVGWSNRGEFGAPKNSRARMSQGIRELVRFFEEEMAAGRLRRLEPWSAARAFVGALHSYVLFSIIHENSRLGPNWTPRAYVRGVVDVLWDGLAPVEKKKRVRR